MATITKIEKEFTLVIAGGSFYTYNGIDSEGNIVATYESESFDSVADAIAQWKYTEGHSFNLH